MDEGEGRRSYEQICLTNNENTCELLLVPIFVFGGDRVVIVSTSLLLLVRLCSFVFCNTSVSAEC